MLEILIGFVTIILLCVIGFIANLFDPDFEVHSLIDCFAGGAVIVIGVGFFLVMVYLLGKGVISIFI